MKCDKNIFLALQSSGSGWSSGLSSADFGASSNGMAGVVSCAADCWLPVAVALVAAGIEPGSSSSKQIISLSPSLLFCKMCT